MTPFVVMLPQFPLSKIGTDPSTCLTLEENRNRARPNWQSQFIFRRVVSSTETTWIRKLYISMNLLYISMNIFYRCLSFLALCPIRLYFFLDFPLSFESFFSFFFSFFSWFFSPFSILGNDKGAEAVSASLPCFSRTVRARNLALCITLLIFFRVFKN